MGFYAAANPPTAQPASGATPEPIPTFSFGAPTSVDPVATIPPGSDVLIFGDSYTEGFGASDPDALGWAPLLAAEKQWNATIDGLGGTGYVNPGPANLTFAQRLDKYDSIAQPYIIIQGGLNDEEQDPAAIQNAAVELIGQVRDLNPSARVLMIGPISPYSQTPPGLTDANRALAAAAEETGTPYLNAMSASINVAGYSQNDARHPNDDGHSYIANRVGERIAS